MLSLRSEEDIGNRRVESTAPRNVRTRACRVISTGSRHVWEGGCDEIPVGVRVPRRVSTIPRSSLPDRTASSVYLGPTVNLSLNTPRPMDLIQVSPFGPKSHSYRGPRYLKNGSHSSLYVHLLWVLPFRFDLRTSRVTSSPHRPRVREVHMSTMARVDNKVNLVNPKGNSGREGRVRRYEHFVS